MQNCVRNKSIDREKGNLEQTANARDGRRRITGVLWNMDVPQYESEESTAGLARWGGFVHLLGGHWHLKVTCEERWTGSAFRTA